MGKSRERRATRGVETLDVDEVQPMANVESRSPSFPVFATVSPVVRQVPEAPASIAVSPRGSDRFESRWNTARGQASGVADLRALGKLTRSDLDQLVILSDSSAVQTVAQLQSRLEQIVDVFSRRGDLRALSPPSTRQPRLVPGRLASPER